MPLPRRISPLLVCLLTPLAAGAAPAAAGTANFDGLGGPAFTPIAGQVNHVSVDASGPDVVFGDSSSTFSGGDCPLTNGFHTATCEIGDAAIVYIDLGDMNDTLDYNLSRVPAYATAGAGNDSISGGPGADRLSGGPGNDIVDGGAGADILDDDFQGLVVQTGGGNDTQSGGSNDDLIMGGDNALTGSGGGIDTIDGGPGTDTYDASARTKPLAISVGAGAGDDGEATEHDTVTAVERVLGGSAGDTLVAGPAASTLAGAGGDDTLVGGAGGDVLDGDSLAGAPGSGDDTLDGGGGADVMRGGDGIDTVSYASRTQAVSVSLDDVADDGEAGEHDNVRSDVERVVTGSGDDTIAARDGRAGSIACGAGNDTVVADTGDTVALDCETVSRPATTAGPGGGVVVTPGQQPPTVTPAAALTLATRTVTATARGTFSLPLVCSAGAGGCAGTLTVRSVARRKRAGKPAIRAAVLLRVTYALAPGGRRSHAVRLPAALRRILTRERALTVTAGAAALIGTSSLPVTTVRVKRAG